MAKNRGWDDRLELINHALEIEMKLEQFWKSVRTDKNKK